MKLDRIALKNHAKALLRGNYWKMVLAGLVMALAIGEMGRSSLTYTYDDVQEVSGGIGFIVALLGLIAAIVITLFVLHPLEYGAAKYYLKNINGEGEGVLLDGFKSENMKQAVTTFFYRDVMIFLFALLFFIPGIIKAYEYYFVPQLTVDHPELSGKDVCMLSSEMTRGRKMELFVLDLSFILWTIGNSLTCGLLGIFYFFPYKYQVRALAYEDLVMQGADPTRA